MEHASRFKERYSELTDDELIQIAVDGDLLPEAQQALTDELSQRGVDLSSRKLSVMQERAADDEELEKKISRVMHRSRTCKRLCYALALLMPLAAAASFYQHMELGISSPIGNLVFGLGAVVLIRVQCWVSKMWSIHIILRKPPR
jgi:hypothetical protein